MCACLIHLDRFDEVEATYAQLLALINKSYVTANDRDQVRPHVVSTPPSPRMKCLKVFLTY